MKYLGIIGKEQIRQAERAYGIAVCLLPVLVGNLRRYEESHRPQKTIWGRVMKAFKLCQSKKAPPYETLTWKIVDDAQFNAGAKKTSSGFEIVINAGAILRMASLCNELAAMCKDGKCKHIFSSIILEGLFKGELSNKAQRYADQIFCLCFMLLLGHEFGHIALGHCEYQDQNKNMSTSIRQALELDADYNGGAALGGWLTQNKELSSALWLKQATTEVLLERCGTAIVVLYALLSTESSHSSKIYLHPEVRAHIFFSGFVNYLSAAATLPKKPSIRIDHRALEIELVKARIEGAFAIVRKTSVGKDLVAGMTAKDEADLVVARGNRDILKAKLVELLPFGMKTYVKKMSGKVKQ